MDAGAVAGLAVGVDRAAMPDRFQRVDAGLHDIAAGLAVERGDKADAAGIVLVFRTVGVAERGGVGGPGGEEVGGGFSHGCAPRRRAGAFAAKWSTRRSRRTTEKVSDMIIRWLLWWQSLP